jgi:hypothetical protein
MTIDNFSAMRILLNYQSLLNFIIILKNPSSLLIISFKTKRFQDLKSDLNYLRENVISKTANSIDNLLKTNISSFMDAINIMKGDFLTKKKLLKHFF